MRAPGHVPDVGVDVRDLSEGRDHRARLPVESELRARVPDVADDAALIDGKTLTICWLADRIHSLFKPGTSEKLVDLVFILTDRKSLDTNIKDEIENFTHLKDVVGLARKAEDLPRFLKGRKPIIVTTQQKTEGNNQFLEFTLTAALPLPVPPATAKTPEAK